jgi:DNA-binding NarL/FixJ family response regulator
VEPTLTATETRVLQMIAGGMSDSEIAFALDVDEEMITAQLAEVYSKLDARDRESAAALAVERGLVDTDL